MSSEIVKLGKMVEDAELTGNLGKRLIAEAIKQIAAEKIGEPLQDPMVSDKLKQGDALPGYAAKLGSILGVGTDGRVASGGSCGWTNLLVWERSWCETETGRIRVPAFFHHPEIESLRLETVLSAEELEVLNKIK